MEAREVDEVRRAIGGDREAYGRLVETYQGMAFGAALNVTGSFADSLDIAQEAFLQAYRRLSGLSDPGRFAPWLYTIARRLALKWLRDERRIPMAEPADAPLDQILSDAETPAEAYARKELSRILWDEVGALPPRTREAILLRYMEGFSIARAAAFLGISEPAMKVRLSFGREKLRRRLLAKIGGEIRRHRPSKKTRDAILAAIACECPTTPPGEGARSTAVAHPSIEPERGPAASPPQASAAAPAATYSIAGRTLERLSRRPIAGLLACLSQETRALADTPTSEDGGFRFHSLDPGTYSVRIRAADPSLGGQYFFPPRTGDARTTGRRGHRRSRVHPPSRRLHPRQGRRCRRPSGRRGASLACTLPVQAPRRVCIERCAGRFLVRGPLPRAPLRDRLRGPRLPPRRGEEHLDPRG